MKTRILLARHGQTDGNLSGIYAGRSDHPLNCRGQEQAQALARRLDLFDLAAICSSPVPRALETARVVAGKTKVQIEGFLTEIEFGAWSGLTGSEVARRYPRQWDLWRLSPQQVVFPNGEGLGDVRTRMAQGLDKIRRLYRGETVLLVTHDVNIRLALLIALGLDDSHYRSFRVDNASLTGLEYPETGVMVLGANDIGHLFQE